MIIAKVETISSVPKVVSAWTEPIKIVEQSKPVDKVLRTSVQSVKIVKDRFKTYIYFYLL